MEKEKEMEKEKARALLDEQEEVQGEGQGDQGEQGEPGEEAGKKEAEMNQGELLKKWTRGTMKLLHPFRAHSQDITELRFDFCALTTEEELDALDSVQTYNFNVITNKQALALFAATAAKCAPETDDDGRKIRLYDAKDIRKRLGPADAIQAVKLAKLFYNASSQAGDSNISRE